MLNIFNINTFTLPYDQYVYLAIGLGMVVSILFAESLGVVAGGIIVPGYFALHLQNIYIVSITFFIAIITYLLVDLFSKYLLIYGRRRLIFCLLFAFLIGLLFRNYIQLDYIGFIIPGLIASWIDRQGIFNTISVIIIESSIVHLILMLIYKYSI